MVVALRQTIADRIGDPLSGPAQERISSVEPTGVRCVRRKSVDAVQHGQRSNRCFLAACPVRSKKRWIRGQPLVRKFVKATRVGSVLGHSIGAHQIVRPSKAGGFPNVLDVAARHVQRQLPPRLLRESNARFGVRSPLVGRSRHRAPLRAVGLILIREHTLAALGRRVCVDLNERPVCGRVRIAAMSGLDRRAFRTCSIPTQPLAQLVARSLRQSPERRRSARARRPLPGNAPRKIRSLDQGVEEPI